MALFSMRDSWNVWRRKVDAALGGSVEPVKSEDVTYDNTDSGLTATNVQSAIDEVEGKVDTLETFNSNIPAGYLLIEETGIQDIIENGTYQNCLDTIAAHLKTVVADLEDDEIIIPTSIILVGNAHLVARPNIFNNTSGDIVLVASVVSSSSNMFIMWNAIAYSDANEPSTLQHMQYSSNAWTFTNDGPNTSGASRKVYCNYMKYKKIK